MERADGFVVFALNHLGRSRSAQWLLLAWCLLGLAAYSVVVGRLDGHGRGPPMWVVLSVLVATAGVLGAHARLVLRAWRLRAGG